MSGISDQIIRLSTPEGTGTGFVYDPSSNTEMIYVITARHCLHSKAGTPWTARELTVGHISANVIVEYPVADNAHFIYGSNNDTEDIGLIMMAKSALPAALCGIAKDSLALAPVGRSVASVTGFPLVVLNERKRTLYQLQYLSDTDYPKQLQFELKDRLSEEFNDDILVEGYSGSPILIDSGDVQYVCGIFLEYEDKLKRVIGFDLTLLDRLLLENGNAGLCLKSVETDLSVLKDIASLRKNTQRVVGRIREKAGTLHLPRQTIADRLRKAIADQQMVLVSGSPGSGKSALVKQVAMEMAEFELIAIQGEQLDQGSIDEIFSGGAFKLVHSLETILDSPGIKALKILLIDSVEKILETAHAETILDFFDLIGKRSDIKLVLTCRSYGLDTLKLRFLQQFPPHLPLNVGLLSDEELAKAGEVYPALLPLLEKPGIRALLRIPFNLDKAVMLSGQQAAALNGEQEFKTAMWSLVVENLTAETDAGIRSKRGVALIQIAIKRAELMSPYVYIPELDPAIVNSLAADQIIDREPGGTGYAAAHDIYEDWALTRHIGHLYQRHIGTNGSVPQFFHELGDAASIRRSFRLWVAEQVQMPDFNIRDTIHTALNSAEVATYWQDALLIAVLQSDYSAAFLEEEKALLFDQDFRIYKRCLVLLNVACQEPDFRHLERFKREEKMQLYHRINLVPFGAGWANMIYLSYQHLDELAAVLPLTVQMVLEWKKGLNFIGLPPEAKEAGQIILRYLQHHTKDYSDRMNRSADADDIEDCLRLLFQLSGKLKEETAALIRVAFNEKDNAEPWQLRNFYDKIIELTISGFEDQEVCRNFPELIIEIAEKEWFYVPPTEEELARMYAGAPFLRGHRSGLNKENDFGIKDSTGMDYFPPGPFHSPMLHLLFAQPLAALRFLVKLMNHAADCYWASDLGQENMFLEAPDNREMISYTLADGTLIRQMGSMTLWNIYRGTYIATPNLLESVLMALEYWLLEVAEVIHKTRSEETRKLYQSVFDKSFDILLRESNNVSTTAVLLSVAYAHRELARPHVLPLLSVGAFYNWDYIRHRLEGQAMAPLGSRRNARYYQQEQFKFNKLPHRSHDLRYLVLNYSLGEDREKIFAIVDALYLLDPGTEWQLQVNSMDARRWEPAGEHEQGILVQPKLEGEMLAAVEESRKETERTGPAEAAMLWSIQRWEDKTEEQDFAHWLKHFNAYRKIANDPSVPKRFKMPGLLAGLGLRDHIGELDAEQAKWCAGQVQEITEHELKRRNETMDDWLKPEYNIFEVNAAFYALPILAVNTNGPTRKHLREEILYVLLNYEQESPRKALQASLRKHGWAKDPQFMLNCIGGMLQFASVSHHRQMVVNMRQYREANDAYWLFWIKAHLKWATRRFKGKRPRPVNIKRSEKILQSEWQKIFDDVDGDRTALDFQAFRLQQKDNFYFVFQALKLIPADTTETDLITFYETLLRYLLDHIQGDEDDYRQRFHITHLQQFHKRLAHFLLRQPEEVSGRFFSLLTDDVYNGDFKNNFRDKKFDLIKGCLETLITETLLEESLAPSFWFVWHRLAGRILETGIGYFSDKVLLDLIYFKSDATDWAPIHGQKALYERFIPQVRNVKSSAKLLASIGFSEMMPEGISWLAGFIGEEWQDEKNTLFWFERIIIRCFYTQEYRKLIKGSSRLRADFIKIVDHLIDKNASASAFLIREDFISRNPGGE
ncbi:ATPase family associated with various cellular activities (AAA) [Mucilaginibacter pineti]|uniref:ATPase family associated with various cellular activities (AAA) n=1 Tax=Mucilaginibacter pineti TaxID=1391627 RepID=A0A1G7C6D3_9SPHI|nr:ATP-binding protein [Mucilaginibacter pineti]SDE34881.1 ATPase family associated with various cellular activities (AAA) [Mucilaginibacter pineti]